MIHRATLRAVRSGRDHAKMRHAGRTAVTGTGRIETMNTRTIGLVGLGAAARQIHLPAYAKLPGLRVVGGSDPAARGGDFPFPLFATVDELLERTRPDILAVVTPTSLHFTHARLGLQAGCHVFCEKPFMSDLDEAAEIVALAHAVGRWAVVNNQYRFMNVHRAAKELIGGPDVGPLLFLSAEQTFVRSDRTEAGWRGEDPRRTCKEFGTHVLDLCRFFFAEDPRVISARMPKPGHPGGPDHLNLIRLEFSGDRVAQITLDRLARGRHRYLDLRLDGGDGCIETSLGGNVHLGVGIQGGARTPYLALDLAPGASARVYTARSGPRGKRIATDPLDIFAAATSRLLGGFLAALDTGGVPPCHGEDNLRTLALMLAAYESHERGVPIEMDYRPAQVGIAR